MKYLIFLIFLFPMSLSSQCNGKILVGPYPADSISICRGDTVQFHANGVCKVINSDFNNKNMGSGWDSYTQPNFDNPCIPNPNGSVYLWLDNSTPAPRYLKTKNFNTNRGGVISFDLRFALQFGGNPCEGPDVDNEGVSLQYSNDNGLTWGDIIYFCPDGQFYQSNPVIPGSYTSGATPFTDWGNYSFSIPSNARTSSTCFRWLQMYSSTNFDNWGLDNIKININISNVLWSTGVDSIDHPIVTPLVTTDYILYTLSHFAGNNDVVGTDTIRIHVYTPIYIDIQDTLICLGKGVKLSVINGCKQYLWSTGSKSPTINVIPLYDTIYSVILTDVYGCINKDTSFITVKPSPTIQIQNDTLCIGEKEMLVASGGSEYLWSTGDTTNYIFYTADTAILSLLVTDTNGCFSERIVTVNPLPIAVVSNDTIVCYKELITIFASGGERYIWSNGVTDSKFNIRPKMNRYFTVQVIDSNNCYSYEDVSIRVNTFHEIVVNATEYDICRTKGTTLEVNGAQNYVWSTGSEDSLIYVEPNYSIDYYVTGYVEYEDLVCQVEKSIYINVEECNTCFIPTAFSPLGANPIFKPVGIFDEISNYSMIIYDMWGKKVFESNNVDVGWDGYINNQLAPIGVYVYQIYFVSIIFEEFYKKGTVTIIR